MKYIMKAGVLYQKDRVTVRIKSSLASPAKKVLSAEGHLLLQTDICNMEVPPDRQGDVRFREYIMTAGQEKPLATAKPNYTEGDDPMAVGWPVCRLPRVDNAQVQINGRTYCLTMQNGQNYLLTESSQKNRDSNSASRTDWRLGHRGGGGFQPGCDMRHLHLLPIHGAGERIPDRLIQRTEGEKTCGQKRHPFPYLSVSSPQTSRKSPLPSCMLP